MGTHRFDVLSFIFGALFLAFTVSVTWNLSLDLGFDIGDWILPVAFLTIGVALLASGIRTAVRKNNLT